MKAVAIFSILFSLNTFASTNADTKCVYERLNAYNSDIFYDYSLSDVEKALASETEYAHNLAVEMADICEMRKFSGEITPKGYQCIAMKLGIENDKSTIDLMLNNSEIKGHKATKRAARFCKAE